MLLLSQTICSKHVPPKPGDDCRGDQAPRGRPPIQRRADPAARSAARAHHGLGPHAEGGGEPRGARLPAGHHHRSPNQRQPDYFASVERLSRPAATPRCDCRQAAHVKLNFPFLQRERERKQSFLLLLRNRMRAKFKCENMNVYCFRIKDVHTKLDDQACEARIRAVFLLSRSSSSFGPALCGHTHSLTHSHTFTIAS